MVYYEGLTCPVCRRRFEANDDVVACPQCGLPHHRACWLTEMHCHEQDKHGTEQQWNRATASESANKGRIPPDGQPKHPQICPHCYTKNAEFAEFCTHCGRTLSVAEWHSVAASPAASYTPFTAAEAVGTINGVSENDLTVLVGTNSHYYLPRFRRIRDANNGGWNWAAFLFGPLWLVYRKQYALGTLLFIFQCILDCATMWLTYPINSATNEAELMTAMTQMMDNPMMLPAFALSLLLTIAHILLGAKGNQLYLHHCTNRIQKARQHTADLSAAEMTSLGGVSIGIAILFYLLSTLLVNGLASMLIL